MYFSNRVLVGVALLSGAAVVGLWARSPVTQRMMILHASGDLSQGTLLTMGPGGNLVATSIPANRVAGDPSVIPEALQALVTGQSLVRSVKRGTPLHVDDVRAQVQATDEKGADSIAFVPLSRQLGPGERAVTIRADELNSFGYALQPDDRIDIVVSETSDAGGDLLRSFANVRVLAVGNRTSEGWNAPGPYRREYNAIVLAVSENDAERLGRIFSALGGVKPRVILRPRNR